MKFELHEMTKEGDGGSMVYGAGGRQGASDRSRPHGVFARRVCSRSKILGPCLLGGFLLTKRL